MPQDTLPWRWHRRWHGHSSHIEDQGGVPGPRDVHVFYRALAEGKRHSRGTVHREEGASLKFDRLGA